MNTLKYTKTDARTTEEFINRLNRSLDSQQCPKRYKKVSEAAERSAKRREDAHLHTSKDKNHSTVPGYMHSTFERDMKEMFNKIDDNVAKDARRARVGYYGRLVMRCHDAFDLIDDKNLANDVLSFIYLVAKGVLPPYPSRDDYAKAEKMYNCHY